MVDEDDGGGIVVLGEVIEVVCLLFFEENIFVKVFVLCFIIIVKIDNYIKLWFLLEKKV